MDLKFKKLLLFTMRMNDANRVILKASPKKTIDLQLFSNVLFYITFLEFISINTDNICLIIVLFSGYDNMF